MASPPTTTTSGISTPQASSAQSSQLADTQTDDVLNTSSCDLSRGSSVSFIDDIDYEIDPNSVDFEPLLVSGTGKILSYHSESHVEEGLSFNDDIAFEISAKNLSETHSNGRSVLVEVQERTRQRQWHDGDCLDLIDQGWQDFIIHSYSFNSFVRVAALIFSVLLLNVGISWFDFNKHTHPLQMAVTKAKLSARGIDSYQIGSISNLDPVIRERMMNVDIAVYNSASKLSTFNVVFWDPFLGHYMVSTNQMRHHTMAVVSQCFKQEVYEFQMDKVTGLHHIQPLGSISYYYSPEQSPEQQQLEPDLRTPSVSHPPTLPMAIFTPSFYSAAITLYDQFHVEANVYFAFLHNPIDIYVDKLLSMQSTRRLTDDDRVYKDDNLFVRYLNGDQNRHREVNDMDLNYAKEILRAKFLVGTCEYPHKTLFRLGYFRGGDDAIKNGSIATNEEESTIEDNNMCDAKKEIWFDECAKMKRKWTQNRNELDEELRIVQMIESKHQYDILLYEYAMQLFEEQSLLFL